MLLVYLTIFGVASFYNELGREDVSELRTKPISAPCDFGFVVVIVAGGEKLTLKCLA